ncbi:amidase family protein [Candidatus Poriferisocius sp.]|uniref:amidase family protein n=1 Tax=Candidatus Poriferisocius sp. TaxID=3101276 RepID=UPI003B01142F
MVILPSSKNQTHNSWTQIRDPCHSGGFGALVTAGGVVWRSLDDQGGSIRMSSALSGNCGVKPMPWLTDVC